MGLGLVQPYSGRRQGPPEDPMKMLGLQGTVARLAGVEVEPPAEFFAEGAARKTDRRRRGRRESGHSTSDWSGTANKMLMLIAQRAEHVKGQYRQVPAQPDPGMEQPLKQSYHWMRRW